MIQKKAVLIGINYPNTEFELKGCVNDVTRMNSCLIDRFGFKKDDITILIDTNPSYTKPTGRNIWQALENLVKSSRSGDILFVHYSGHGFQMPLESGDLDSTGYDECIVPCDYLLITDDDFKELVCQVPDGCRLTLVSDSCKSGGLISGAKEQIGESTKSNQDDDTGGSDSSRNISSYKDKVRRSLESFGVHVPRRRSYVKSRYLPLPSLIHMLKQETGTDDIGAGNIRHTHYEKFGDDASRPKVKKSIMTFILQKVKDWEGKGAGLVSFVKSLAAEYKNVKHEWKDNVFAGTSKGQLPTKGIHLSGCQSYEKSEEDSRWWKPSEHYGAFSNSIQVILAQSRGEVSNEQLVLRATKLLEKHSFIQRPGLYCTDENVHAPFICHFKGNT